MKKYNDNAAIEFDAIEFIWGLFEQWKLIVIVALVCAVLAEGVWYISSMKNTVTENKTLTAEDYEKKLSDEDKINVERALRAYDQIVQLKEYEAESLLMKVDAYNERLIMIPFMVDNNGSLDDTEVGAVVYQYVLYAGSTDFAEKFSEKMGWDYDARYVSELLNGTVVFSSSESTEAGNGLFRVSVKMIDDHSEQEVAEAVGEIISSYDITIEGISDGYTLIPGQSSESTYIDRDTISAQSTTVSSISSKESALNLCVKELKGDSLALYNLYISEKEGTYNADSGIVEDTVSKGGFSIKILILGFVAGAFLYVVWYFISCLFWPKVNRITDIENLLPEKCAGHIVLPERTGKGLKESTFVNRLHDGNPKPIEDQITDVKSALDFKLHCSNEPDSAVSYLYWSDITEEHRKAISGLVAENEVVELSDKTNADTYKKLDGLKNTIIIVEYNRTPRKRLSELLSLLGQNGSDIIGYVSIA